MSKDEKSLLLYLETRSVDHRGFVDAQHMNADDFKICERWEAEGFLRFSRIPSKEWKAVDQYRPGVRHAVELSDLAWAVASLERKRRAERTKHQIVVLSLEHF
jgi:hypothetical protein